MRSICLIVSLLLSVVAMAQFSITGAYYDVPNVSGVDHVVVFADLSDAAASLEYTGSGTPRWTDYHGNVLQQGTGAETFYPEHNTGYFLYEGSTQVASFYVIDYKQCAPSFDNATLTAEMECQQTILTLTADIPALSYQTTAGQTKSVPRDATITYTSLMWAEGAWTDSIAVADVTLQGGTAGTPFAQTLTVDAPYKATDFCLRLDPFAEQYLGLLPDSLCSDEYDAVAVCAHPQSVTTSRDYNGLGAENEPLRPIDEETLTGSAPLEINFLSNGNKPTALYYRWQIFKGTDLIAERFDEDQRYTFTTNGAYQVKVWVYNDHCTTDSTVFDISVSESLLKVPNVFTPNGDGMNDEFRVVYRSLAEFHCWVYNRWGKLVYKWDDPAKGWDGTINGRPAAEGAYYYIIRARGTDADVNIKYHKTTKRKPADIGVYQLSGSINLIRGRNQ